MTDGTSAQLTNQSAPDATVAGADQPSAFRSDHLSVAEAPSRSIQLRSAPRDETVNCGCALPGAAGVASGAT